jgi:hypothetical protein
MFKDTLPDQILKNQQKLGVIMSNMLRNFIMFENNFALFYRKTNWKNINQCIPGILFYVTRISHKYFVAKNAFQV